MDPQRDEGTLAALAPGVHVDRAGDVLVVALEGEHDIASAEAVRRAVGEALDAGLAVAVDLRRAYFIDSAVAGALLDARKRARQRGLGFGVVLNEARENDVRRMFELSTLTNVFALYPSLDAAIAGVRNGFVERN